MEIRSFQHEREIKLDKNGAAIRVTVVSDSETLPPYADRLSKDIAASLAIYARKSTVMPENITVDYTPQAEDAVRNGESGTRALIEPLEPRFQLDDFICDPEFRSLLDDLLFFTRNSREIRQRMPARSITRGTLINFFGHSGTGKTMVAEALAASLEKKLYILNYANIESSLLGKTARNISQVFRSIDPRGGILMLDEADAFVSSRVSQLNQGAEYALNAARSQIIREIDRFDGLIILATNLFGTYDSAVLRRIKFNLFFDLPSPAAIEKMFRAFLPEDPALPELDLCHLAALSTGLAGGDILNICEIILVRAIQHHKKTGEPVSQADLEQVVDFYQAKNRYRAEQRTRMLPSQPEKTTQGALIANEPERN